MDALVVYRTPHTRVRVGRPGDGGYVICALEGGYDCMLSGGIANDVSFEQDFLTRYGPMPCYAFDGTVASLPVQDTRINFVRKNLGAANTATLTNLHTYMEPYTNIFMKIDIEGHEFRLFPSFTADHLRRIKQLVLEVHTPADIAAHPAYFAGLQDVRPAHMFALFQQLLPTHTLVHVHPNNGCATHTLEGIPFPNVFECTFVRNDCVTEKARNTETLPTSLDMPNVPSKPVVTFRGAPWTA